jgi:hypothetical protein
MIELFTLALVSMVIMICIWVLYYCVIKRFVEGFSVYALEFCPTFSTRTLSQLLSRIQQTSCGAMISNNNINTATRPTVTEVGKVLRDYLAAWSRWPATQQFFRRQTRCGTYNYPMCISRRTRVSGWFWGLNERGIVQFGDARSSFRFIRVTGNTSGYFTFREPLHIQVQLSDNSWVYIGPANQTYQTKCVRCLTVKTGKDQAGCFRIMPYYKTCQKNCPEEVDQMCFPVIMFEHCRPRIEVWWDTGYTPLGEGKNPVTLTWNKFPWIQTQNVSGAARDNENTQDVYFIDAESNKLGGSDYTKSIEDEYSLFKYQPDIPNSLMKTYGMCNKCINFDVLMPP